MPAFQNPFGYDWKKSAFLQLFELLGIRKDSKSAARLKKTLKELCETHLDIELTSNSQKDSMKKVEDELKRKYPDTFNKEESEENLYYAIRAVVSIHNCRRAGKTSVQRKLEDRKRAKKQGRANGPSFIDLSELTSDGSESGDESVDVEESVRVLPDVVDRTNHRTCGALSWRSDPDTTKIGPSGSAPSRSACVPLRRSDSTSLRKNPARGHSSSIRSTTPVRIHNLTASPIINGNRTLQSHSVNGSLQVGPFPSLSGQNKLVNSSSREKVPKATNEKENWPTDDSQIVLVLRFLQTCTPSMGRFLHCFVEYGCLNVDHLRSISIWPRGERRELLKQILRIGSMEGEDFSRTDIAVLEKQFDDHFR